MLSKGINNETIWKEEKISEGMCSIQLLMNGVCGYCVCGNEKKQSMKVFGLSIKERNPESI